MRIQKSVEIGSSIDEVFAFIRDPNNDPKWCPTVQRSRQVVGDGPTVGAVYEQVHKPGPAAPSELEVELLEIDAPHRLRLRSTDDLATFDVRYDLERLSSGGTRLTQTDDARFHGFAKLLQPVMWFAIHRGIEKQFEELERLMQGE